MVEEAGAAIRKVRWTPQMKREFFDHLAASCHVRAAAAAAGVRTEAVYYQRRHDKRFAAAWAEALQAGYQMLETRLVGHALAGGGRMMDAGSADALDADLALRLLGQHRGAVSGKAPGAGTAPRAATREETDAAILKRLALLEKAETVQVPG